MVAVPSQRTWTAGESLLATQLNDDVRDALNFLLNPPAFLGYLASAVVATSAASFGVDRALTEAYDNDGMHAGTDNFVTIQTQGRYSVTAWGEIEAAAAGSRGVRATLNTVQLTMLRVRASDAGTWSGETSIDVDLEVGDLISVQFYQNSGGNLNISGGLSPMASGLSVRWIGVGD